ncbi:MAG: hypothetical protein ACK4V9_14935 [Aphanizomenon sp.]
MTSNYLYLYDFATSANSKKVLILGALGIARKFLLMGEEGLEPATN